MTKKKKKNFFQLQNSSKEKGKDERIASESQPQRTNLEQRPQSASLYAERTMVIFIQKKRAANVDGCGDGLTGYLLPQSPTPKPTLQNESLGLPTLGNRHKHQGGQPQPRVLLCLEELAICVLEGRGPAQPSHPQGTARGEREGGWFSPSLSLPQNCIIKIPIQSSHGGGERKRKTEALRPCV